MKFPWKRREEEERVKRLKAEKRAQEADQDWVQLRRHKHSIDKEVGLNDWTQTAKQLFAGKAP